MYHIKIDVFARECVPDVGNKLYRFECIDVWVDHCHGFQTDNNYAMVIVWGPLSGSIATQLLTSKHAREENWHIHFVNCNCIQQLASLFTVSSLVEYSHFGVNVSVTMNNYINVHFPNRNDVETHCFILSIDEGAKYSARGCRYILDHHKYFYV